MFLNDQLIGGIKYVFLNEKEEKVIGKFLNRTNSIQGEELNLIWDDGSQVHALYDIVVLLKQNTDR